MIKPAKVNQGLKPFIIGKLWTSSKDSNRPGALVISRSLQESFEISAGQRFNLFPNTKREGKQDADYSVSMLLPEAEADRLIEAERAFNATRGTVDEEEVA